MLKSNSSLHQIWTAYEQGELYNTSVGLYETVQRNENFFIGKQWEGLKAPDLEKPVLNFLKRVVSYFISMIVSDDVGASLTPFHNDRENEQVCKLLSKEIEQVIEDAAVKSKHRDLLRNTAVDGDGCFYLWFDPEAENGQPTKGKIHIDNIENTKVLFGNPHSPDVQAQPFIQIIMRKPLEMVREDARTFGASESEIEAIRTEKEENFGESEDSSDDLVTVVVTMVKDKQSGTVHAAMSTRDVFIRKWWDTKYRLYPVAYQCWDKVRSSYHGQAAITGLIPNQIFVNKIWAMAMEQQKNLAFPFTFYDITRFPNGFKGGASRQIGVSGNPNEAILSSFRSPDMSNQVLELVQRTIDYTRDFMGASDAALGNIRPDNTSAIIAVQKASAAPLELQRMTFYQFVEDYVRIILDMIRVHYGLRAVSVEDASGNAMQSVFDFSRVKYDEMRLKVDVGASAYWSELMQIQTLDNLFAKGIITDAITYLEGIPDTYVKNKNKIIQKLKEQSALMSVQNQLGGAANAMPQM